MIKRPLTFMALIVLSGITCGLHDISKVVRLTAFLFMLFVIMYVKRGTAGVPLFLYNLGCFILGYIKNAPQDAHSCEEEKGRKRPHSARECAKAHSFCKPVQNVSIGKPVILIGMLFLLGYARADHEYRSFQTEEAKEFFDRYSPGNPGVFDYGLYLKSKGIGSEKQLEENKNKEGGFDLARGYAIERLRGSMLKQDAGIIEAMLLGEKSDMDMSLKDIYRRAGISHIMSISGLHVSIAGMTFLFILNRLRLGIKKSLVGAVAMTIGYGLLTGSSVSTIRAIIMLLIRYMGMYRGRGYDMPTGVAVAAVTILMYRPYMLTQAGFQLSFAAVLSICCIAPVLIRSTELLMGRRTNGLINALIISISIQLATLPIIAYHYFEINIYSVLLNLIVVPLAGLVICSGVLVILTAWMGDLMEHFPLPVKELSVFVGAPAHYILRLYKLLAETSLGLPYAMLRLGRPRLWQIFIYYVVLICMTMILKMLCTNHKKGRHDRQIKKKTAAAVAAFSLFVLLTPLSLARQDSRELVIVNMDVGQGDCCLLMHQGRAVLIDGGSSSVRNISDRVIKRVLGYYGVDSIAAVIVSHADADHINGITEIIESDWIDIELMILPEPARRHEKYDRLMKAFKENGNDGARDRIKYINGGDLIKISDKLLIKCIQGGVEDNRDVNRHSPMLMIEYGEFKMLSTGDAVAVDEERLCGLIRKDKSKFDIDFYSAAHHGSGGSNTDELMELLQPEYIFCSCGYKNRYGHPDARIIRFANENDIKCLISHETGAVIIETDGRKTDVSTMK